MLHFNTQKHAFFLILQISNLAGMCTFQSLWVDTSSSALPFLCIYWQRCWNTMPRAPLLLQPCVCKCVCVCVCLCHVTEKSDRCAAHPGLINYSPGWCHVAVGQNTHMEPQPPTGKHWEDMRICMLVCWMKVLFTALTASTSPISFYIRLLVCSSSLMMLTYNLLSLKRG